MVLGASGALHVTARRAASGSKAEPTNCWVPTFGKALRKWLMTVPGSVWGLVTPCLLTKAMQKSTCPIMPDMLLRVASVSAAAKSGSSDAALLKHVNAPRLEKMLWSLRQVEPERTQPTDPAPAMMRAMHSFGRSRREWPCRPQIIGVTLGERNTSTPGSWQRAHHLIISVLHFRILAF